MKKTIVYVRVALGFFEDKVNALLPFAKGIRDKIFVDPDIHIDPVVQGKLKDQIIELDKTVVKRKTDLSKDLTKTEAGQTYDVLLTLKDIARTTERDANALTPGNEAAIQTIILRIGFAIATVGVKAGRTFEVFKTLVGKAFIRVRKDKAVLLYHRRWSLDEITWNRVADSVVASVVIFGLPSKTLVYFQSAETLKVKVTPQINAIYQEPIWGDTISELIP
jgi:hypothetical protein